MMGAMRWFILAVQCFSISAFIFLTFETIVVKIAMISPASRWMSFNDGSEIWQSSMRNSIHSWDSSASWSRTSSLEQNSESVRARDASRACDATEVAERSHCLPNVATSALFFGSFIYARMVEAPNALVRPLISWLRRMGEMRGKSWRGKRWNAEKLKCWKQNER